MHCPPPRPSIMTRTACIALIMLGAGCADSEEPKTEHLDPIDLGWIRQAEGQIAQVDRGPHRLDVDRDPFAPPGTTTISPSGSRRPTARHSDLVLQGVVAFGDRELAILNNSFTELGGAVEYDGKVWTVGAIDAENVAVRIEIQNDDGTVTSRTIAQVTE